jgi:transcriptional regulator with XRE-family HTH domain
MTKNDFGYKIKRALQDADLTQSQVAKKLKLTPQQVSNWILNKNYPSLDTFIKLVKIVGKDANYFLGLPAASIEGNGNIYGNYNFQIAHNSEDIQFLKKELADLKRQFNSSQKTK